MHGYELEKVLHFCLSHAEADVEDVTETDLDFIHQAWLGLKTTLSLESQYSFNALTQTNTAMASLTILFISAFIYSVLGDLGEKAWLCLFACIMFVWQKVNFFFFPKAGSLLSLPPSIIFLALFVHSLPVLSFVQCLYYNKPCPFSKYPMAR